MTKENVIHLVRSAKDKSKRRADILHSMKVVFNSYKLRISPKNNKPCIHETKEALHVMVIPCDFYFHYAALSI
jgi:hypothetical protein